jgi:hypothetical protein
VGEDAIKLRGLTEKSPERTGRCGCKQVPAGVREHLARSALRRQPPALQGSGLAARPRARRLSGEESGWPSRSVCPSVPPGWSAAPRKGGRGRAGPSAQSPPHWSGLRLLAGVLPLAWTPHPRAWLTRTGGCGLLGSDRETCGQMVELRHSGAGRAPTLKPKCSVTPELRALSRWKQAHLPPTRRRG